MDKRQLRREMKALRNAIAVEDRQRHSARIQERIQSLPEAHSAQAWFVYLSYRSEVETYELVRQLLAKGKTVLVPGPALGTALSLLRLCDLESLETGPFGIPAPQHVEPWNGSAEICLTPGLAFTERGDRLGYGQGHYDRTLTERPEMLVVGLAFEQQIVPSLPIEPHDRPMDLIVTERRVISPSPFATLFNS